MYPEGFEIMPGDTLTLSKLNGVLKLLKHFKNHLI